MYWMDLTHLLRICKEKYFCLSHNLSLDVSCLTSTCISCNEICFPQSITEWHITAEYYSRQQQYQLWSLCIKKWIVACCTHALNCDKLKCDSSTLQSMTFFILQISYHFSDSINLQVHNYSGAIQYGRLSQLAGKGECLSPIGHATLYN